MQLSSDISSWSLCGLKYAIAFMLPCSWNSLEDFLTGSENKLPPHTGNEERDKTGTVLNWMCWSTSRAADGARLSRGGGCEESEGL